MDPGTLQDRVTIYTQAAGADDLGQPNGSWGTLATVWAQVRYVNGVEAIKADAVTAQTKASIRIRRRSDITTGMRVVFGSVTFNILGILPDTRSREVMDLVCEATS